MHVIKCVWGKNPAENITFMIGLYPKMTNEWNKWKNHFYDIKGDVGMSRHEKERASLGPGTHIASLRH